MLLAAFSAVDSAAQSNDENSSEPKPSRLPTLALSTGCLNFLGDVGYSHFNEPLFSKRAFQFEIQKHTNSNFAFSLFFLSGKVFGDEKTALRQVNFLANVMAEGLQVRYDFKSSKRSGQLLTPYISAGAEYLMFQPKGDMKDANGNLYHYWSDGSIRSIAQSDANASQAKMLYRDYKYETDLREADIDGLGKYRPSTFAFPVGAGVALHLSGRVAMHFGSTVHFTSTDLIDNVNTDSKGSRKGNGKKDKLLYSFFLFRYDLSAPRDVPKKAKSGQDKSDFKNVDFKSLSMEDADGDGIPDIDDDVIDTANNMKVDSRGRPIDSDGDGIPDYRDLEPKSAKGALVNEDGVTITEEMIEEKWKKDSLAALPAIIEYLHYAESRKANTTPDGSAEPGARQSKQDTGNVYIVRKPIPERFGALDKDKNGYLSASELIKAVDDYLSGKSPYTVPQFYELIDFFFSQP